MYYDDFNDFDIADEGFFCNAETKVGDLLKIIRSNIASSLTTPEQAANFLNDISHEIVEFNELITEIQNAYGECNSGLISKEDAHAIISSGAAKLKSQCRALKLMPAGVLSDSDDIEYEELSAIRELLAGCKTLAEERYQELTDFPGDGSWGKAATLVHAAGESTGLDDEEVMLLAMEGLLSKAKEKLKRKKKNGDDEDLDDVDGDSDDDSDDEDDKKSKKKKRKLFGRFRKKKDDEDEDAEESWFDFDDDFDSAFEGYDEWDEFEDEFDSAFESYDEFEDDWDEAFESEHGLLSGYYIRKTYPIAARANDLFKDAKKMKKSDPEESARKFKDAQNMYEKALKQALRTSGSSHNDAELISFFRSRIDRCRAYILKLNGDDRRMGKILKSFREERTRDRGRMLYGVDIDKRGFDI